MADTRLFTFVGGQTGAWRVVEFKTVAGQGLPAVERVENIAGPVPALPAGAAWALRGVTSNERYVASAERDQLVAHQPAIGRPAATCAALIPIRKTAAWWGLAQDERRAILEERSHHIADGLRLLPAVARRLHHCRDLGEDAPFDFLTWFEYAPADAAAFETFVGELRGTEEWAYVEREIDIRLVRD